MIFLSLFLCIHKTAPEHIYINTLHYNITMTIRNKKIHFLLQQPKIKKEMRTINLAYSLSQSKAIRMFFVETLLFPQRPSYFNKEEVDKTYELKIWQNNLGKYAKRIERDFGAELIKLKEESHKKRFWFVNWKAFGESTRLTFFGKLDLKNQKKIFDNPFYRVYKTLLALSLKEKSFNSIKELKKELFDVELASFQNAYDFISNAAYINYEPSVFDLTLKIVKINSVSDKKEFNAFMKPLKEEFVQRQIQGTKLKKIMAGYNKLSPKEEEKFEEEMFQKMRDTIENAYDSLKD